MTNQELSLKILELVGGKENVTAATNCMTRLRVNLKDYAKADIEGLKATEGVLQVIEMDNLHIVLGKRLHIAQADVLLSLAKV